MVHRKVYKCEYQGKLCVIKKVPFSDSYSKKSVESELSVLRNVSHPRIVKMVLFFSTSVDWNFVLEYMEKGSLRDMIKKYQNNSWTIEQSPLLKLFMDVVVAVKFLHSKGIMHRDLKPENILVSSSDRLKVADFGISKIRSSQNATLQTIVGTTIYMAPEVIWQQPYEKSVDSELKKVKKIIIKTLNS